MNIEKLAAANNLSGRINKLNTLLNRLQPEKISVLVAPNKENAQLMTIGCADTCEHELAPLAAEFLASVRAHYQAQHDALTAEFDAL